MPEDYGVPLSNIDGQVLETGRIAKQLISQGISHPEVSLRVGMQKVVVLKTFLRSRTAGGGLGCAEFQSLFVFPEIPGMLGFHRIKAADAGQVDYRNSPYISGFLDDLDIVIDVQAEFVRVVLVGLDVVFGAIEIAPVDWCQQDYLLGGVIMLQERHEYVDVGPDSVPFHDRGAVSQGRHDPVTVDLGGSFFEPFAQWAGPVEIIGPYEYDYGIYILPMLGEQLPGLSEDLGGPMAADPVAVRLDAKDCPELVPIDVLAPELAFIGDGIPEESDFCSIPLTLDLRFAVVEAQEGQQGK